MKPTALLLFALFLLPAAETHSVSGSFDVKITPLTLDDKDAGTRFARMALVKHYHGDLEAEAKGEMLTAGTAIKDSAGYVAIEKVAGTLRGRKGSFALQHSATMNRGVPQLSITVVPDSGTEELTGLTGSMTVQIDGAKHGYVFEFTMPDGR